MAPIKVPPTHKVVYEKKTGKAIIRHSVDCAELVESGEYSYAPPSRPQWMQDSDEPQFVAPQSSTETVLAIREVAQRIVNGSDDEAKQLIGSIALDGSDPFAEEKIGLTYGMESSYRARKPILKLLQEARKGLAKPESQGAPHPREPVATNPAAGNPA